MDVENRIRELRQELAMLEAMRNAPPPNQYLRYEDEPPAESPYLRHATPARPMPPPDSGIEVMPYRNPKQGWDGKSGIELMPYRKPKPSLDGPRRPNQYIKNM